MSSTMIAGFKFRNKVRRHTGLWKQHSASNAAIQAVKLAGSETKLYRSVENAAPPKIIFRKL